MLLLQGVSLLFIRDQLNRLTSCIVDHALAKFLLPLSTGHGVFFDSRYEQRSIAEEFILLFQCTTFTLREEEVDCECVGESADGEDDVVFPSDGGECGRGDLCLYFGVSYTVSNLAPDSHCRVRRSLTIIKFAAHAAIDVKAVPFARVAVFKISTGLGVRRWMLSDTSIHFITRDGAREAHYAQDNGPIPAEKAKLKIQVIITNAMPAGLLPVDAGYTA